MVARMSDPKSDTDAAVVRITCSGWRALIIVLIVYMCMYVYRTGSNVVCSLLIVLPCSPLLARVCFTQLSNLAGCIVYY